MYRFTLFRCHSVFGSGQLFFVFLALMLTLPGSALEPGPPRIKAGSRAAFRNARDVLISPQTQCFLSCLDTACSGSTAIPGSTTTSTTVSTTTGTGTTTTSGTTTTGTGTTTTIDTTTTGTGTTTTTTDTTTTGTFGAPDCIVSAYPYQPLYSPTACSEIILYASVTGCTSVWGRSQRVHFDLEGLPSTCFDTSNYNSYSYYDSFPTTIIFTPVRENTIVCDVGQGLKYSGNITATDDNYYPPKRLATWSITVDTTGMEHCVGTYVSQLYPRCLVMFDIISGNQQPFRPTSCGRTDLARAVLNPGCDYFSSLTVRYELSGFESCSAVQFADGILFFEVANGKTCNITSAQQHKGVLKAFNSYNVELYDSGAWATWPDITLLTGGIQSCPPIWSGSVTTTVTTTSTSTTTGTTTTTTMTTT